MSASAAPRLLYFAGKYFPGSMAIQMHRDLLDELRTLGLETTILSLGPRQQRRPVEDTVEDGLRVIRVATVASSLDRGLNLASKHLLHYDFFLSGARRLAGVLRGLDFDIAQGQMAFPYGAMLTAALDLAHQRQPLIVNLAGGDLIASDEARYGYARYASVRLLLRYAFRRAGIVRANSPVVAERALELGCPADHLRVVPVNISRVLLPDEPLDAFRQRCRARLRSAHGLPEGPILLAVGRLIPIKGFDWLIRALPALVERWPALSLVIVGPEVSGEEAHAEALRQEATSLGLAGHVHFLGARPLEAMRDVYAAADLLVVPTLFEGLNKAVIEAGANGVPGIVTESTGIVPYVVEAGAGRVVPSRDAAAIAAAVEDLLADRVAWETCAAGARRLAERFTPAAIGRDLLPHYAALLPPAHPWRREVETASPHPNLTPRVSV